MTRSKAMQIWTERTALLAREKQDQLSLLLGAYNHELDLDAGVIRFSGGHEIPFQVLGTESDNSLTWLWAWADEHEEVAPEQLSTAHALTEWGAREQVAEFITPSFDLEVSDGVTIAMVASVVANASCYFEEAYDGGSTFFLLNHPSIAGQHPFDRVRLLQHLTELAENSDVNQKNALIAYLGAKHLPFEDAKGAVTARLMSGERLQARFDSAGRLLTAAGHTGDA